MRKPEVAFEELDLKGATKGKKAPLFGSSRLPLFIIFLLATCNFVLQRFNINFGIVCMHRPLPPPVLLEPDFLSGPGENATVPNILGNVTNSAESLPLESSSLVLGDPAGNLAGGESLLENHHNNQSQQSHNNGSNSNWITSEPIDKVSSTGTISGGGGNRCGGGVAARRKKNQTLHQQDLGDGFITEFEWSKETKGGILAAFYYGLTFSQIPGGWFVDRFGAKAAILTSQLFLSILSLVNPAAAMLGPEYMFVTRLLQGVANGAAMPAINVLATRWCADMERSFLLGITYAGFGLATAIVYPISAFFCENMGWQWIFYFAGGTGLMWCVAAFFLVFEWPENHPRIKMAELQFIQKHRAVQYGGAKRQVIRTPWIAMLTSIPIWAMLMTNFACFWCFLTISAYLPTYLTEVLDLDISDNGLLSALPFVGMMSFHFFAAALFDWLRKKKICSVTFLRKFFNSLGMFSSALSMLALGIIPCDNVVGSVILFTLCQTFLEFSFMGGYLFSIFEIAPKYASSLTALSNTFGLLTGFISPAVVSWLTPDGTREQWLNVFYVSAGINVFGGLVYLLFGKCTLLPWAAPDGTNTVVDGSGSMSRNNSKRIEQELKSLKIRLINGESDVKGQTVRS